MDPISATNDLLKAAAQGDESLVRSLMQQKADALYQAILRSLYCLTILSLKFRDDPVMKVTATAVCMQIHLL